MALTVCLLALVLAGCGGASPPFRFDGINKIRHISGSDKFILCFSKIFNACCFKLLYTVKHRERLS